MAADNSLGKKLTGDVLSLEDLRAKLKITTAISTLGEVEALLKAKGSVLSRNEIDALRLRVEIVKIRLAKVIPDVKSVEYNMSAEAGKVQFVLNLEGVDGRVS